jgi:hypothetical protein
VPALLTNPAAAQPALLTNSAAARHYSVKNASGARAASNRLLEGQQDVDARRVGWIATDGPRRLSVLAGSDEVAWASVRVVHVRSYPRSRRREATLMGTGRSTTASLRSTTERDKATSDRPAEVASAK